MLDDEPTTTPTDTPAPAKAVRRRRATSAAAAPAAAPPDSAELTAPTAAAVTADGIGDVPGDVSGDALAAPVKRARKAPAKKAEGTAAPRTRTRAAKAAGPAAVSATEAVAAVVAGALPEADPADDASSLAPTVDPVAGDLPVAALDAPAVPGVAESRVAESAIPDAAPTGRSRSRRSSRAAGTIEDSPAVAAAVSSDIAVAPGDVPGADVPDAHAPAGDAPAGEDAAPRTRRRRAATPPAVMFQAPEADEPTAEPRRPSRRSAAASPVDDAGAAASGQDGDTDGPGGQDTAAAPRRRRRAGTSGAASPSALMPTLLEPSVPTPDDEDEDEEASEDAIVPDDAEALGAAAEGDEDDDRPRRRRRGRRGRGRRPEGEDGGEDAGAGEETGSDTAGDDPARGQAAGPAGATEDDDAEDDDGSPSGTRRRRRRRRGAGGDTDGDGDGVPTVVHVREPRPSGSSGRARTGATSADEDGVRGITGSTRMAAKRVRRQEGRDSGRKRAPILSEAEFLARREAVDRVMVVRQTGDRTQIAVLEDGVLVEHYVTKASAQAYAGNVYLGRVQNVLPSMEAAFVDIGKGRNGVLYAGEVNWEGGGNRKIEQALKGGQEVLVQVSKDPLGHKGARLTSQISLPGRYLVYVPQGSMTGISRKLPETERARLKSILKTVVPDDAGVIIRTAAEGASEEEIAADVRRLQAQWEVISTRAAAKDTASGGTAPKLLHAEPDLVIRVVRDVFNEDFASLVVQGDSEWETIRDYVEFVAPDLAPRLSRHTAGTDVFAEHRVDEQLAKGLDRKVWLPSGGSLVIDRTEAMIVIDVNTGKYVGKGGNLEETVTRNNLEAAEEIARQLRLRDLGGIIVVDFIDMVLESNRDLVVRRLVECMGRDRTKHQVAEVTSLGLVQMTRKRVGQGLLESFSETCEACHGRGVLVSATPVDIAPSSERFDDRPRVDRKPRVTPPDAPKPRSATAVVGDTEAPVLDPLPAGAPGDEPAEDAPAPAGRRRRRSGRGGGAAAATVDVVPDELEQPVLAEPRSEPEPAPDPESEPEPEPVEAEVEVEVADLEVEADLDVVTDLADQPTPAQEDHPVVAELPAGDEDDEPTQDPDQEPEVAKTAAPRRRRRATSRPAGPPAA